MLHKLKKHLMILYTASTGAVFIGILVVLYFLSVSEQQKNDMERFLMTADSMMNKLQSSPMINLSELSVLEAKYQMIIEIEDNGCPITFESGWHSKTDRKLLILQMKEAVKLEISDSHSHYSGIKRSSITKIKGIKADRYYGCVIIIPVSDSTRSLVLLYSTDNIDTYLRSSAVVFIMIAVVGMLLLFLINNLVIDRTLIPIRESNQRQVEFIASASHELRSPLAYIQTSTGELKTDCIPYMQEKAKVTLQDYIDNAGEELQRMSALIEDMLLLASADTKTWSVHRITVDGDTFFIESYEALSRHCSLHKHELLLNLPEDFLGEIEIDPHRVYQILQILVNNAYSYTPEHSQISISVHKTKRQLLIEVIDHGTGIPDEEKKRVFDRYFRRDQSRNDKSHFGLGLNIAMELAHLQQGELVLFDTIGGGCTFKLTLPLKRS